METRKDAACTKKWHNSQLVDCGHYTEEEEEEEEEELPLIVRQGPLFIGMFSECYTSWSSHIYYVSMSRSRACLLLP